MRKRFIVPAILALVAALGLGSCVLEAGNTYAKVDWGNYYTLNVNSDFWSTSGFGLLPNKATYYNISTGTHYFTYFLTGGPLPSSTFAVTYDIEPVYGAVNSNVPSNYFDIWCDYFSGGSVTPFSRGISSGLKPDGVPVTIQKGAYKMTISVKQVELTDAEKASFIPLGAKSE